MKKQLLKSALIAVAGVGLMAGSSWADLTNDRTTQVTIKTSGESTLQTVINNAFTGYNVPGLTDTPINVATDQSEAAIWTPSEGDTATYMLALITAGTNGVLGIYSYADNSKTYEFASFDGTSGTVKADFSILIDGTLQVGSTEISGFGSTFGFYWRNGNSYQYTEDSRNAGSAARALAYEVAADTTLLAQGFIRQTDGSLLASSAGYGITALGTTSGASNDWILAFEDGTDMDFQDAVFYIEDMTAAVPEPTTMLLFGSGLLGLAGLARRQKK